MIGWSRLLAGGIRDPLVGRDVLAGIALGVFSGLLALVQQFLLMRFGAPPPCRCRSSRCRGF